MRSEGLGAGTASRQSRPRGEQQASDKAKQKQDRRVEGEENDRANPQLSQRFLREQGGIRAPARIASAAASWRPQQRAADKCACREGKGSCGGP